MCTIEEFELGQAYRRINKLEDKVNRLENYGILIEDIKAYCKLQPKTNYTAQRILEAIEQGYWG